MGIWCLEAIWTFRNFYLRWGGLNPAGSSDSRTDVLTTTPYTNWLTECMGGVGKFGNMVLEAIWTF